MFRRIVLVTALCALVASSAAPQSATAPASRPAQTRAPNRTPPSPSPPPPPAPAKEAREVGQPINLKIELVITDQRGTAAPVKKTISAVIADGLEGMIRSESQIPGVGSVPLHMDARPKILDSGKIRVHMGLQYDLPRLATNNTEPSLTNFSPTKTEIREDVTLILEDGKPIVVTQSADPMSDRQVTVEVKATILR